MNLMCWIRDKRPRPKGGRTGSYARDWPLAEGTGRCSCHAIALIAATMDGLSGWRDPMADHGEVTYTTADGNDYVAHEQTYLGFLTLVKWGTICIIAILALMAIFLT
jgi:hypothetical protein